MVKNLKDLMTKFSDEITCREHLIKQRWPDGKVKCQYCGHDHCYRIEKGNRFKCANNKCYKRFKVTVGTIFEASNIPLNKWFPAMYLVMSHKKGISSIQLSKDIGVSQKTGWFMLHRIREQLKANNSPMLSGMVEIDESYIGGKVHNMSKSKRELHKQTPFLKAPLVSMLERGGNVISKVMTGTTKENIIPFVNENVADNSRIMTDNNQVYLPLKDIYQHSTVNHDKYEYVNADTHTNSVEGYFGLFKRMIYGIYHKVSLKHLQRYVDEHNFRYNSRKQKDGDRFYASLGNMEGRLTYKQLINTPEFELKRSEINLVADTLLPAKTSKKGRKEKPICIMTKEGEVLATYKSAAEAAHATGFLLSNIRRAAQNPTRTTYGYKWKYI